MNIRDLLGCDTDSPKNDLSYLNSNHSFYRKEIVFFFENFFQSKPSSIKSRGLFVWLLFQGIFSAR